MKSAAIYARYSSDKQSETSIDDQIALCREFAARNAFEIVSVYSDAAKSGSSLFGRSGLLSLLADAQNRAFEAVLVENLDRISRDQEDIAGVYKRLSFSGVEITQVHGGKADKMQVGLRGLLGSIYLQDLADKTHRGLSGQVAVGKSAGGKAYGYRPIKGEPGELEIVAEEAEVVRRVYREFVSGKSPRAIAHDLNRDKVLAPRGAAWGQSALNGMKARGNGMLRLSIYAGVLVWNKVHYVRDPETGRRVTRPNPPSEWKRIEVPHLRIIDQDLWDAVQKRLDETGGKPGRTNRPAKRRLLSGLIKCAVCGSGMAVNGTSKGLLRVCCSRYRESGSCDHKRSYYLHMIERGVVDIVRQLLEDPASLSAYIDSYVAERRRLVGDLTKRRSRAEAELAKAKSAHERALKNLIYGHITTESWLAVRPELERNIALAEAELARTEAPPKINLHPAAVANYKSALDNLHDVMCQDTEDANEAFSTSLRDIVHAVLVHPVATGAPIRLEVHGKFAALIGESGAISLVAGAGFEPAAFRL